MKASIVRASPSGTMNVHSAQTQCQVQAPQASNRATILLVVAHKVSKVARLKEACKHSKLAPNVRVESNTKQRFMLATKQPNNNVSRASRRQTVKQGVSPAGKGLINSSRPVKRGGSSHTSYSYGCHRVSKQSCSAFLALQTALKRHQTTVQVLCISRRHVWREYGSAARTCEKACLHRSLKRPSSKLVVELRASS